MFVSCILCCFYNPFALRVAHTKAPPNANNKKFWDPHFKKWVKKGSSPQDVSVPCGLPGTGLWAVNAKAMGLTSHPLKAGAKIWFYSSWQCSHCSAESHQFRTLRSSIVVSFPFETEKLLWENLLCWKSEGANGLWSVWVNLTRDVFIGITQFNIA